MLISLKIKVNIPIVVSNEKRTCSSNVGTNMDLN